MIKFLLVCLAALPVLAFLRTTLFKRSRALRQAGADFNRQVGYMAIGMLGIAGIALIFYVYQLFARR